MFQTMRRQIMSVNYFRIIFHDAASASWHIWVHSDGVPSRLKRVRSAIKVAFGKELWYAQELDVIPLDVTIGQVRFFHGPFDIAKLAERF